MSADCNKQIWSRHASDKIPDGGVITSLTIWVLTKAYFVSERIPIRRKYSNVSIYPFIIKTVPI